MAVHLNCQLFQGGTENREIMNETRSDPSVCGWNKVIVRKKYCPGQGDFPVRQATFYSHFLMGKNPGKWSAHWTKKYITCPCKQNFRGAFPKGKLKFKFVFSPGAFTFTGIPRIQTSLILYQSKGLACTLKLSVS